MKRKKQLEREITTRRFQQPSALKLLATTLRDIWKKKRDRPRHEWACATQNHHTDICTFNNEDMARQAAMQEDRVLSLKGQNLNHDARRFARTSQTPRRITFTCCSHSCGASVPVQSFVLVLEPGIIHSTRDLLLGLSYFSLREFFEIRTVKYGEGGNAQAESCSRTHDRDRIK